MPTDSVTEGYRFDSFELYPAERQLLAQGRHVALGPRAFDLLVELVDHAGHLLTKDELLDRVWPGVVVEENNLQVQVSTLRKVLGAAAIETIPGRGYRFTIRPARADGAAAGARPARHHNLPRSLTRFIGHEQDFDSYAHALAESRLVTLTGVGGCGKTRLAIELAFRLVPDFPDGVWFVDFAPTADAARVASIVATTLGVKERAGQAILDALLDHVAGRRMLLVLDNCEHLVAACGETAGALLDRAAELRVLATSREVLGVAGERVFGVRSLLFPAAGSALDAESIASFEAVQLFVDRAQLVDPGFALDSRRAPVVAEIARRLDGIPLAIELAAARTRVLSMQELCTRLHDRFRLLVAGSRAALPRQKTLLATIQWSYDLLTSDEQRLLQALSVFAGGWTLQAAAAVAGASADAFGLLDGLTRLVDKSLVVARQDGIGEMRYSLLETVRQYAQERLAETDRGDEARARHLEFFLALAEEALVALNGPEQAAWFARLDLERENLLAAHVECGRFEGRGEHGLRLVHAIRDYWIHRAGVELGYRVTGEALARRSAQAPSRARCRALTSLATIASCMGHFAEAQAHLEASLAVAREVGDVEFVVRNHRMLGEQLISQGRLADARRQIETAIPLARQLTRKNELCVVLIGLAEIHRMERDYERAEMLYEESLGLARDGGDVRLIIVALLDLACVSIARAHATRAAEFLREAIPLIEQTGSKALRAYGLQICAGQAALHGAPERAARLHGYAAREAEEVGYLLEPADEAFLSPLFALAREALGAEAYAAAEAAGRALSREAAMVETRAMIEPS